MKKFLLTIVLVLFAGQAEAGFDVLNLGSLGLGGSGNNQRLAFYTPLTSTLNVLAPPRALPGTTGTFTRASAAYLTDFEGVTRKIESGSVGVEGSRVVTNLFLNSGATATQNITLPVGRYTSWITGTGSITSSAGTAVGSGFGAATEGAENVITITSPGTVTFTKAGVVATAQVEPNTGSSSTTPSEYVATTSVAVTKCFSADKSGVALPQAYPERANSTAYALNSEIQVSGWWYNCTTAGTSAGSAPTFATGKAGLVTVTDGTVTWTLGGRLLLGYVSEPASTNKTTAYGIIPADTLGPELASGTLTVGQKYQITARTDANFVADGAVDNNVGTQFVATAATVTLDAGDKVKRVQWGVGEKSFHNGTAFVQNITGLTLSGDTAAVLSIVTDQTEIEKAGLANINPTYKVYKLDNSAGSVDAWVAVTGNTGNTNYHSLSFTGRSIGSCKLWNNAGTTLATFNSANYTKVKADNVLPVASTDKLLVATPATTTVYFLLPQLEELPYATSINPSLGATSTRAATSLSYPISGNLTSPTWSAKITATPAAISQDGKFLLGSYLDANNSVGLLMSGANAVARKRLTGSNNDATKALTLAANTTKRFGLRGSLTGWSLFVDGVKGTDSSNTSTPAAGTTLQIGADGNSANGFYGYFKDLYLYNKPLTDGRF